MKHKVLSVEHVGIAVADIQSSNKLFNEILGIPAYKMEFVESENVTTSFFQVGKTKIELLEANENKSAIQKYIEKKGEGIHHIALLVEDIKASMAYFADKGFKLLNSEPKVGADNKWICFLHPKETNGVLVELCQEREKR
ncbi:MAG: methylmalonyl-CoA epimerase [Chitinophagales bacterium]|nr:methylmalonyl-CoA epimerase [Bacteroidota bacterium]MCB9042440.1 methylmalonyl-CoA epimerase [Chitinophagales bacterium]